MPVVVLDEIGLAEDSKKMPLKALHSLLENGGTDNTKIGFIGNAFFMMQMKPTELLLCIFKMLKMLTQFSNVGKWYHIEPRKYTGISNWSLDPAKMNRGLYVTRQLPDLDELRMTAIQICKENMRDKVKFSSLN